MTEALSQAQALELLRQMLLIRRFEERLVHLYEQGVFQGHYHLYIGQEATGVAAIARLEARDYLFTTHRNHGHLLARGVAPERLLAEILGRASGLNGGRSGTLHPVAPELGILQTSAIVGGCVPLAAGAAFSARYRGSGQVAMVFFGDGVLEEGAFYEALNMAALWKLPLVLVCENNSIPPELRAAGQFPSSTHAARQLVEVAQSFTLPCSVVDGADLEAVYAVLGEMVARARRGEGPSFVEARNSRWPGNYPLYPAIVGGNTELRWAWDPQAAPAEVREWTDRSDPIVLWIRQVLARGATRQEVEALDAQLVQQVDRATEWAMQAPWPEPSTALQGVFAEGRPA
ncbi:MAG: thiamine pyrophosphate-dependent dehydrogenase E1 component subunit alpha [Chloroflexi bacterium]|nr:thiamine pyrophosphate-dependent dehydrogenase E1 component subunit alpha [Chloroflexota bacterium]